MHRLFTIVVVIAAALFGMRPADAYTPSVDEHMGGTRWATPQTVQWSFVQGFPTGARRTRVLDGFDAFNILNQPLKFSTSPGPDLDPDDLNFCNLVDANSRSYVEWVELGGSALGGDQNCIVWTVGADGVPRTQWAQFRIFIDANVGTNGVPGAQWWLSPDNIPAAPPWYQDLWSVASHEVGHAAGMRFGGPDGGGHFDEASDHVCPGATHGDYLERETMCQQNLWQARVQRNHDDHDRAVFMNAY